MPSKICKGCQLKIGFFKKKFSCQICRGFFCVTCSGSVKSNEEQLQDKLLVLTGFNCLRCIILEFREIKRDHLYLLQNKHLNEYLTAKNISTVSCTEKYDLIDLIMEYAKTHNKQSREDSAKEFQHDHHLQNLRQAAEDMRVQENVSSPQPSNTSSDVSDGTGNARHSGTNFSSTSPHSSTQDDTGVIRDEASPTSIFNDHITIEDLEDDQDIPGDEAQSPQHDEENANTTNYSSTSTTFTTSHHQQQQQNRQTQSPSSESTENSTTFSRETSASFTARQHQTSSSSPRQSSSRDDSQEQPSSPRETNTTTSSTTDTTSGENLAPPPSTKQRAKWRSMEDVSTIHEINSLTVLELKQILTANFIDYKGCVEKKELIDKVKMLYESREKNKARVQETTKQSGGPNYDRDDCKICMDATIDCVLLNCGHLVACSKCGKRLSECPICRALVVRVVHIFRV
ncbi:E3 ubiquitin-protein ligase RNF34-like [Clytia hemisphaerica]|uniref:RING-type domain-containing protein n=1 Tax=Clytia hemisphaerica TaxID=252671 RepID=A0A7M5XKR8_9CNID